MAWADAVSGADRHTIPFRLDHRLDGGLQTGARLIRASDDSPAVLKVTADEGLAARRDETAALVARLVTRGYPTPVWRRSGVSLDGIGYVITDLVDGITPIWDQVDPQALNDAVELQAEIADPSPSTWSDYARTVVAPDSPQLRILRTAEDSCGAVLTHVDAALRTLGDVTLPRLDAVHGDLGLGNTLLSADELSIVDTDAVGPGCRALDHARLYRDALTGGADLHVVSQIRAAGESVAGPAAFHVCVVVDCVDVLAFAVRRVGEVRPAREVRPTEEVRDGRADIGTEAARVLSCLESME